MKIIITNSKYQIFLLLFLHFPAFLFPQTDTVKKPDTTLKIDTIIKRDTIIQKDTLIHVDTLIKPSADFIMTDTTGKAPVIFNSDTLFFVYTKIGAFSQKDRAEFIIQRMNNLLKSDASLDTFWITNQGSNTDIIIDSVIVMSVTNEDAFHFQKNRHEIAMAYGEKIHSALIQRYEDSSFQRILLSILYAFVATVILIILLRLLSKYFPLIYDKIESWNGIYFKSIKLQNLELITAERLIKIIAVVFKVIRVILTLLILYVYVPLVLNFFPQTRRFSKKLISYITDPLSQLFNGIIDYLPNLFFILVAVVVAYYVIKVVKFFFIEIEKGVINFSGFYKEWAMPSYKMVRFLIHAFTLIVIFPYLPGSNSPAFQGISIFFGVLISFGSTSAISNLVAGIVLLYMRAFNLGDRVKIADTVGDVIEKNLLVTRIKTIKNVNITVPNALVLSNHIINFSTVAKESGVILHTTVTIGYDAPWKKVHELLLSAADVTSLILKEPNPFILQTSLDDYYVSYELNVYTREPNKMAVIYSELHQNIQDKFNEAGVEIMSPSYTGVRDGNHITIPEDYLPKDYKASSFRIFGFGNSKKEG